MFIEITEEMHERANQEVQRREFNINHHFILNYQTADESSMVGFLGEFACCQLLGIDWRNNIRDNYDTTDNGDITINDLVFDVKTETVPQRFYDRVCAREVNDDGTYGRRLINENQVGLLPGYDFVIFGALDRETKQNWHFLGYLDTESILNNYELTNTSPNGNHYPFACLPIRTSELGTFEQLQNLLDIH